jgi:hypothetical protein
MKPADLKEVFEALAGEQVRYLVVGGLAVNVHGLGRMTSDDGGVRRALPRPGHET